MKTIGVIANCAKPRAGDVLRRMAIAAARLGLQLVSDEETGALLEGAKKVPLDGLFDPVDAVMALGGDGTMLRAVREMGEKDKPLMGVNIGSLGFLTSVAEQDLEKALECLANDGVEMSTRDIADSIVARGDEEIARYRALNEVLISSGPSSRIITLDVLVDGDCVTSYACDGLIVSTPTGSTGHSLSAGGPILVPETAAFVISVICPHTLSSRPLVVPAESAITVRLSSTAEELVLSIDGQESRNLRQEDTVTVRRAERSVRFLHLPGYSYFSILRQKLHWRGSSVENP